MDKGWIKFHRKFLDWEWYSDVNVKLVFIHILLKSNYTNKNWQGEIIKRGSFVTSLKNLENEIGLTKSQVRTAINKLKNSKQIALKTTNENTLITVMNYEFYQSNVFVDDIRIAHQMTNESQTNDKRIANESQTNDTPIALTKELKNLRTKELKNLRKETKSAREEEPTKLNYAEFVKLTENEYLKLITNFGEEKTKKCVEILDNYKGSVGKTYKSDYRAILNWVTKRADEDNLKQSNNKGNNNQFLDALYQFEEGGIEIGH